MYLARKSGGVGLMVATSKDGNDRSGLDCGIALSACKGEISANAISRPLAQTDFVNIGSPFHLHLFFFAPSCLKAIAAHGSHAPEDGGDQHECDHREEPEKRAFDPL